MTDARMPERFLTDRRFAKLSADDFRAYVYSLMWSVSNRTEGIIDEQDIALILFMQSMTPSRLVAAGVWAIHPDGYLIVDFEATQTTKAQLEAIDQKRISDRDRQARHRQKKTEPADSVTGDVTRDITREDKGKARTGKDRTGEADKPNHLQSVRPPDFQDEYNSMQRDALTDWGVKSA